MAKFFYTERLSGENSLRLETLFNQAISEGFGGNLYERAKAQGLAGRKTNLYEDLRHYKATYQAKTPEAMERADRWYENVYKPLRAQMGNSTSKVNKLLNSVRAATIETVEAAQDIATYSDQYEKEFI